VDKLKHREITDLIIRTFFKVYNTLGHGFLEKVYRNSFADEACKLGLNVERELPVQVIYNQAVVGNYYPDFLVNDVVIIEIKAVSQLAVAHESQLINYLKSTPYEIGLLMNFGEKAEFRRRIMDNDRKGNLSWYSPWCSPKSSPHK
jgi:GxxExxY protein